GASIWARFVQITLSRRPTWCMPAQASPLTPSNSMCGCLKTWPDAASESFFASTNMLILGHRGYHATVPENTLEAFAQALALGADGIETDIRLSADELPILFHDRST